MARNHARILTAAWTDDDFRALPAASQHLYIACVSAPKVSYVGVLDYLPARMAVIAADLTASRVERAVLPLIQRRFVVLDRDTSELLVRSFVRHDGLLTQPNVSKAMAKAYREVMSNKVRAVVLNELRRLYAEMPDAKGWKEGVAVQDAELFTEVSTEPFQEPFAEPFGQAVA